MPILVAANQAIDCPDATHSEHRKAVAQESGGVSLHPGSQPASSVTHPVGPTPDPNWRLLQTLTRDAHRYEAAGNEAMASQFRLACRNVRRTIRLRTAQEFAQSLAELVALDGGAA